MSVTVTRRPEPTDAHPRPAQPVTSRETTLEGTAKMAGCARRFLRRTATAWSVEVDAVEAAEVIVSELFTNAVQHAQAERIRLRLRRQHALLHVEVFDPQPHGELVAARPGPDAEDGRGLEIVEALCRRWGRRPDADRCGSVSWACLPAPGAEPAQHDRAADREQPCEAGNLPRPVAMMPVHPVPVPSEGDLVPPSPLPPPTLYESWEVLADGLHVQRLALHLPQLREQLTTQTAGTGITVAALVARPAEVPTAQALALIDAAGLSAWVDLPAEHGRSDAAVSPLASVAEDVHALLLPGVTDDALRGAVRVVAAASAWWVGVFAAIRHLGVHHSSLTPVKDTVGPDTLREAVRVVALGTAQRVLAHQLRHDASEEAVRLAYCRAVTEGIVIEPTLPALLEELGELRLVDLVTTSIPWRGRFAKYAGGTGAGQVE
ncbi:ATP-binding protein [Streptomyces sp. NPDC017454]|uniref:ATP-binding protein n=1 Tax=Streptomyces sp. NPDC017454 TaxID=3364997 RepID=UPI0037B50E72